MTCFSPDIYERIRVFRLLPSLKTNLPRIVKDCNETGEKRAKSLIFCLCVWKSKTKPCMLFMCKFTGIYILFFIQFHVKLLFYEKTTTLLYTYHHHYHKRQAHLFVAVAFIVWSLVTRVESNYKKTKHYAKANKLFICRCVYLICFV